MQFEVPQFIEIESKIFGPLTWRQFLYVGGGGAMVVVLFLIAPIYLFVLVGLPIAILAAALGFFPINNQPFSVFLEAIYNYTRKQKMYLWRQKRNIIHKQSFAPITTIENPVIRGNPSGNSKKGIASLARRLELNALQKK